MFNEYSDGCILMGVVWPDGPGRQMLGVDVVLSAGEENNDSLTGEKLGIGVRKGRLSNCAMGGEFSRFGVSCGEEVLGEGMVESMAAPAKPK